MNQLLPTLQIFLSICEFFKESDAPIFNWHSIADFPLSVNPSKSRMLQFETKSCWFPSAIIRLHPTITQGAQVFLELLLPKWSLAACGS